MQKITLYLLIMIIFTGCNPKSSVPVTTSPYETQELNTATPTEVSIQVTDPFVITPENIDQLELLDRWGKGFAYDMDISPDGKTVVVSTTTGVYLYDNETLEETVILNEEFLRKKDAGQQATAVAFSPDGKYLAVAYDRIYIWDLSENRIVKKIKDFVADDLIGSIAFSYDGNQIVTMGFGHIPICHGGNFQIYDIQKEKMLYHRYFCLESAIFYFRVSNDGRIFFTGINPELSNISYETTVVEASTGKVLQRIVLDGDQMLYDLSKDGSLAAIQPSYFDDETTKILELNTQNVIKEMDGNIIFLPSSDFFMSQGIESFIGWNLVDQNDNIICRFDDGGNQLRLSVEVFQTRFKLRGNYLVVMSYWVQEIQIWDTTNCEFILSIPFSYGEYRPIFSPDGNTLAISSSYYLHLWDTSTGEIRQTIPGSGNVGPMWKFTFNSTGTQIVAVTRDEPYILKFYDSTTGKLVKELRGNSSSSTKIAVSPDGRVLATSSSDGLSLWDLNSGSVYFSSNNFNLFSDKPFSPDGSRLAVVSQDVLYIIDVKNGKTLRKIELPKLPKNPHEAVFSLDWKYLFVGGLDGFIYLLDLEKGVLVNELIGHHQISGRYTSLSDLAISPDGRMIISVGNNQIRFWDVQTGALVGEINPDFSIKYIEFSPDGRLIATTGDDGTIRIWGIPQPEP